MTELEKIAYTKAFIDKLANGINPTDGTQIPDGDVANNVRVSRCFFYVSDILSRVIEAGGIPEKEQKKEKRRRIPKSERIPFTLTLEQTEDFECSAEPIGTSELAKRIYAAANNERMEGITYKRITAWLQNAGLLYDQDMGTGKTSKRPTEQGIRLGISVRTRVSKNGEYQMLVYNAQAQRFIVDNIASVVNMR